MDNVTPASPSDERKKRAGGGHGSSIAYQQFGSGESPSCPQETSCGIRWGCALVQFLGLLALGGASYQGFQQAISFFGGFDRTLFFIWAGGGFVVFLILFVIGSEMSKKLVCGNCGNCLDNKHVKICRVCGCGLK